MSVKHRDLLFFVAEDSREQAHRICLLRPVICALVVHPIFGGLFKHSSAEWYACRDQAERHARDWRNLGYPVDVVTVRQVTESEYDRTVPEVLRILPANTPSAHAFSWSA